MPPALWACNPQWMAEVLLSKKFEVLTEITRASHFAWHAAVRKVCPSVDPMQVTLEMWRLTGEQTGDAYARKINRQLPLAPQVAASICWSSACMGGGAVFEEAGARGALVVHRACPWQRWHERNGLVGEDRPGCDEWFRATIQTINETLGTQLR